MELTHEQWSALGQRAMLIERRAHDAFLAIVARDYEAYCKSMEYAENDAVFAGDAIRMRQACANPPMMMGESEGGC